MLNHAKTPKATPSQRGVFGVFVRFVQSRGVQAPGFRPDRGTRS
jgi:hypothetical protein